MRLTTKTRYGTRAMLDIALHHGDGPLTAAEIASHQELSMKYLESILAELRNAGLLVSLRGAQGGYLLSRPPAEINLRQIFEVLEGTQGLVECSGSAPSCTRRDGCVAREVWAEMYDACLSVLEDRSLQDLALRTQAMGDS